MANVLISSLLRQAKITANLTNNIAESTRLDAIFITPQEQFRAPLVKGLSESADFIQDRSEMIVLTVALQPGVYQDKLLRYRDDLVVQVISATSSEVRVREFAAVPLADNDPRAASNSAANANFSAQDSIALQQFRFQLIDKGFAKMKNLVVSDNFSMANVESVLSIMMQEISSKLEMEPDSKYKGMYVHSPIDNVNKYRQILVPTGTRFINLPLYLQNHDEYGVYSKGLGCFYKQGWWWVYPTFNTTLVDTHHRPIDLIRFPRDKVPTLETSMYVSDDAITILSTGDGKHRDASDIRKQNVGVGKRIVMGDAISGDQGYHYSKGKAITTRQETLQEYKLSERKSGEDYIPLDLNPTGNVCKALSANAVNEGEFLTVPWINGDTGYLEPGHPVRYQYMSDDDKMTTRNGVLIGYRTDYLPVTDGPVPKMKRTSVLHIFLKRQDRYKAPVEN